VKTQTESGEIECGMECREIDSGRGYYTGVAGDGTGTLALETVHGDVRVALRAHETA